MLQYTASQSAAAHIMKPVVSISMSPESFSSGVSGRGGARNSPAKVAGLLDGSTSIPARLPLSSCSCCCGDYGTRGERRRVFYRTSGTRIAPRFGLESITSESFPGASLHVDGRPRRLHLVRRQARALARSHHPRPHPLAPLRPRGIRGRARLQDRVARHRHLPLEGTHGPAVQFREDLHDGGSVRQGRAHGGAEEVVRANKLESCYLRPIAFYGSEKMGVSPLGARVHVAVAAWPWGAYLGEEGLKRGIRVKTSSFARHHVNATMARAKLASTYANSILANLEATQEGYDEGLLLDTDGFVAEGPGENIFIVKDGRVYTPQLTTALDGITWRSVQSICADLGIAVEKTRITRDDVYIADEAFFTGTAAEVTPIRELD